MQYIQNFTNTQLIVGRLAIAPGKSAPVADSEVESNDVLYAVRSGWAKVTPTEQADVPFEAPGVTFARPDILGSPTPPVSKPVPESLPEAPVAEVAPEAAPVEVVAEVVEEEKPARAKKKAQE